MTGVSTVKKLAIWHAIAPTYGATIVTITDVLPWTAQIRYHHLVHWHTAGLTPTTGMEDPPLDVIVTTDAHIMITRIDPGSVTPNLVEVWYSLEQYIGLKEDKLSSTTVDFIRSHHQT